MPTARSSTERVPPAGWTPSPTCGTCSASAPRPYAARAPRASPSWSCSGSPSSRPWGRCSSTGPGRATFLDDHLGAMLAGFLALAVASSMASGGGRELIPREQAAIHPISHRTEHLGALALAPLNFAWLLQAWLLLGITARVTGPDGWVGGQVVVAAWIVCATALAQVLGWVVETVRRTPHGVAVVRGLAVVLVTVGVGLQATDRLLPMLDATPTRVLADTVTARDGPARRPGAGRPDRGRGRRRCAARRRRAASYAS